MPAYQATNAPTQLDIEKMFSALNANGSVAKGCRFIVKINLSPLLQRLSYSQEISSLIYACEAAEFPGRGFQVSEVRYYGPRQVMPTNTVYGDGINFGFLCRSNSLERQFFDDWMDIINPPTSYHFKFPNEYYTDIDIYHYAEYGKTSGSLVASDVNGIPRSANPRNTYQPEVIYGWKLHKAWPTMVNPQQVTWIDSDVLRLQVTFSFKKWSRPGDSEQISTKI